MSWRYLAPCMAALLACSKPDSAPRRTEPWLASATASSRGELQSGAPLSFHFVPESVVRFAVPGKKAKVQGQVPVSGGTLRVDALDLKVSSARLEVDLSQLSIDESSVPPAEDGGTAAPSEAAREWLELGADVSPEKRKQFTMARFELASVDSVSSRSLDFDPRAKSRVRVGLVGTLLLHGFRAPVRPEVVLSPIPVAAGSPRRLSIRSATPLVLDLVPHDVVARGRSGVVDALAAGRAADWIGKRAHLQVDLVAEEDSNAK